MVIATKFGNVRTADGRSLGINGIAFVAYSPLGRGFLTGRFRTPDDLAPGDWRRSNPRFQDGNFQRNLDLAAQVQAMAAAKGCTPAQLALAWLLSRGEDVIPIPGSTRAERVEENLGALDIGASVELAPSAERLGYVRSGSPSITACRALRARRRKS